MMDYICDIPVRRTIDEIALVAGAVIYFAIRALAKAAIYGVLLAPIMTLIAYAWLPTLGGVSSGLSHPLSSLTIAEIFPSPLLLLSAQFVGVLVFARECFRRALSR